MENVTKKHGKFLAQSYYKLLPERSPFFLPIFGRVTRLRGGSDEKVEVLPWRHSTAIGFLAGRYELAAEVAPFIKSAWTIECER